VFEGLMERCISITFGKDLLEETRQQPQNGAEWCVFRQIELGARKVASPTSLNLYALYETAFT
jgi:hypothetical protein